MASAFSDLQRALVRSILIALRHEQKSTVSHLHTQIEADEGVTAYRTKVLGRGESNISLSVVSEFLKGNRKPSDDMMQLYLAYLRNIKVLDAQIFFNLGNQTSDAARPMSENLRRRLNAFPHSAAYNCSEIYQSWIGLNFLHLQKTDSEKQRATFEAVLYQSRLNESQARLLQRANEGVCDTKSSMYGELAWVGSVYRLKLTAREMNVATNNISLSNFADCVLTKDEMGHHRLSVAFLDKSENLEMARCTPLHKEIDPPILTKMVRNNMINLRERFWDSGTLRVEHQKATEEDAESETIVGDQTTLNQRLIQAAQDGNAREMALAIVEGADINACEIGERGASVVHLVALNGSTFSLDVIVHNSVAHIELVEDLANMGVTDLQAADRILRAAQAKLDVAVVDSEFFFPSEYVPDVSIVDARTNPIAKTRLHLYSTLMALEDRDLVGKNMPHGLSFGYDPHERAKYFEVDQTSAATPLPPGL